MSDKKKDLSFWKFDTGHTPTAKHNQRNYNERMLCQLLRCKGNWSRFLVALSVLLVARVFSYYGRHDRILLPMWQGGFSENNGWKLPKNRCLDYRIYNENRTKTSPDMPRSDHVCTRFCIGPNSQQTVNYWVLLRDGSSSALVVRQLNWEGFNMHEGLLHTFNAIWSSTESYTQLRYLQSCARRSTKAWCSNVMPWRWVRLRIFRFTVV